MTPAKTEKGRVGAVLGGWDISRRDLVGALLAVPFSHATEPIKGGASTAPTKH